MTNVLVLTDELRLEADLLMQKAELNKQSAETTLAFRSLQMAKSWMGKIKGSLGAESPYKVVSEEKEIPKTAEVNQEEVYVGGNHLDNINQIRQEIKDLHLKVGQVYCQNVFLKDELYLHGDIYKYTSRIKQHLSEARFWYGFELARIREKALA